MKKILMVFGTRPEAIKMAPLVREIRRYPGDIDLKLCVTAQHRDMLDQVLDLFSIQPDYDLDVMSHGQSLPDLVANMLAKLNVVLSVEKPDCVMIHGDTATALTAALAAFLSQIPIAHVEAGLRTHDVHSPWPEEFSRTVAGIAAELHFAPTQSAARNLEIHQGKQREIYVTGNTGIDSLLYVSQTLLHQASTTARLKAKYSFVEKFSRFILVTNHRRENFGSRMEGIFTAISDLAEQHPDVGFVFPVHKNPKVRDAVRDALLNLPNIHLIDPVEYVDFVYLMSKCYLIITDSGGIQEEAPSLGKPVILTRDTSERPEAIEAGTVRMVGYDGDALKKSVNSLLLSEVLYQEMSCIKNPYGNGTAALRIVDVLRQTNFAELLKRRMVGRGR